MKNTYTDDQGNFYSIDINNLIHLNDKIIGKIIYLQDKIRYFKTEKDSQIFKKTNAWSINKVILDRVDEIVFKTETATYTISKTDAINNGDYFHFKNSTEPKVYVPLNYWNKDER